MADTKTYTTNYNLVKPGQDDFYNVDDFNDNADKMDAALYAHKTASVLDHPDNSVTDAKIGNRTITDTVTAATGAGTITNLLSKLGNMIKQITGKSAWYTAPATTLQALFDLIVSAPAANKLLKLDANSKLPADITGNSATATKLQTARKINTVYFDGSADINLTPANIGAAPGGYGLGTIGTVTTDLHAITETGFYRYVANTTNAPTTAVGVVTAEIWDGNTLFLTAKDTNGNIFTSKKSSGTWSAWEQTATLSGGNYTGAINEAYITMVSAATMNIGSAAGNVINVTGNTTISSFGTAPQGARRTLRFSEALTVVHSANILLPGNVNIAAAGGDAIEVIFWGGTVWVCTDYQPKAGYAPAGYGLGGTSTILTAGDANTLISNGFYQVSNPGSTNLPTATTAHLLVYGVNSTKTHVSQLATDVINGQTYSRSMVAFTWSAWKQIATTDQTTASATAYDSAHLFSVNGYQKLSNGLILQWGRFTDGTNGDYTLTFPIAFPTACFNVQLTANMDVIWNSNNADPKVRSYSTTGATVSINSTGMFWFAIGN